MPLRTRLCKPPTPVTLPTKPDHHPFCGLHGQANHLVHGAAGWTVPPTVIGYCCFLISAQRVDSQAALSPDRRSGQTWRSCKATATLKLAWWALPLSLSASAPGLSQLSPFKCPAMVPTSWGLIFSTPGFFHHRQHGCHHTNCVHALAATAGLPFPLQPPAAHRPSRTPGLPTFAPAAPCPTR